MPYFRVNRAGWGRLSELGQGGVQSVTHFSWISSSFNVRFTQSPSLHVQGAPYSLLWTSLQEQELGFVEARLAVLCVITWLSPETWPEPCSWERQELLL